MSNKDKISELSKTLGEPEWLLGWREAKLSGAESLPKEIKYGIGILGVLPKTLRGSTSENCEDYEVEPRSVFSQVVDYHVDSSKGLELYTWKEALAQEEIAPMLEGLLSSEFFPQASNYFSGMAQALFRSGLVVYVQPGMDERGMLTAEKLTLDTAISEGSSSDLVVVIAKEGAKLEFVSALAGGNDESVFARTLIVLTERDANVSITQKSGLAKGTILSSSRGIVASHASVSWSEIFSGNSSIKSELDNQLIGEGARAEILQGVIGGGTARYDILASTTHRASHTYSRIRTAGVAGGESKTVYRGLIDMKEGVSAVDGAQEARFLILSEKAEVDAIPALDIASKDVQCAHKLSISHIRDTDTFYPKLRGISGEESRNIFLEGHFAHVFSGEENEEIMKEIRKTL